MSFSVCSVTAKTYQNQFIGEDSKISYFRYTTTDGVEHHVSNFTFGWSGSNFNIGFTTPSGELEIYNFLIAFEPDSDFIYYLDKSKYYTFSFTAGSIGETSIVSSLSDVAVALKDSSGNLAVSYNSTQGDTGSSYKWFHVTFTPEQIQRIDNIALVQFQFAYNPALVVDHKYIRFDFHSVATITETYPEADEITSAIKDSTTEITDEIQDQTTQQKGFFKELGDRISGFFDNLADKIKGFFETLLNGIIEGLKSLFIPADVVDPVTGETVDYFTWYFDDWDRWLEDHFGALYFPFAIFFDVLDKVVNFRPPTNPSITFPGLTIMGQELLKPIAYDFSVIPIPWLETVHDLYLFAVDALIGFWIVRLGYKKLQEILGGSG